MSSLGFLVETNVTNMFNAEVQVGESVNFIEDLIVIDHQVDNVSSKMLIPDNRAEMIIPFGAELKIRIVGHSRDISLKRNIGYFLMPRGRGLELKLSETGIICFILKINPIYAKRIADLFKVVANGVFKMNFIETFIETLKETYSNSNHERLYDLIENELVNSIEEKFVNYTISDSIERIKHSSGSITVKEIYSSLCVSKSKLEQHFNREIGLTPKEFCKIEKINYFIRSYRKQEGKSLTELTYECGYYDQSHLIKDFQYFMDISPKKYFDSPKCLD